MRARRASTVAVASVVATTLLVVLLAAWASSIGPSGVLRGDGLPSPSRPSATATSTPSQPSQQQAQEQDADTGGTRPWVRALAALVDLAVLAAALVATVLLVRRARRVRRERLARRRKDEAVASAFEVLPATAAAREILADAPEQRALLLEGSPRNAVVACWHRFETQAARAGLDRHPWETSSEYTMRVLDLVDAYQPAVTRLGELYREARFSEHEVTEALRQEALDALDTIHRTIGVPA
jgi:Domain of unknown function (DUF4129)